MDKKLEARIARLERMMNCKSVKNEISRLEYDIRNDIDTAASEVKKATFKLGRLLRRFGDDDLMNLFNKLSAAADEMLIATGEILHEEDIDD
jgi:hypothetical protein